MRNSTYNIQRSLREMKISKDIYNPDEDEKITYIGSFINANKLALKAGSSGNCDCKEVIRYLLNEITYLKRRVEILESYHRHNDKVDLERLKLLVSSIQLIETPYRVIDVKNVLNFLVSVIDTCIIDVSITQLSQVEGIYDYTMLKEKYDEIIGFLMENTSLRGFQEIPSQYTLESVKECTNDLITKLQA